MRLPRLVATARGGKTLESGKIDGGGQAAKECSPRELPAEPPLSGK
jgi:hypothetical protein